MGSEARIGVVGATGAVGQVTLALLAERGYERVRAFASASSAGTSVPFGRRELTIEEATPEALETAGVDLFLFSVGTSASLELVPHAVAGGAMAIDKSSAYRLVDGVPLVVPEVNGDRALEHDGVVANPNCCTIPLTCALEPLHREPLVSPASALRPTSRCRVPVRARWSGCSPRRPPTTICAWTGTSTESSSTRRRRSARRAARSSSCRSLPISATCVRVPILVGHSEAIWVETEEPLSPEAATELLAASPAVQLEDVPSPRKAAASDRVLVGRIRRDPTAENGLCLFVPCDNLRKGAALNAIQIAELLLGAQALAA